MKKTDSRFLLIILLVLFISNIMKGDFAPPLPEPGTAIVDGNISEWDLTKDFFAEMREAGKLEKDLLSKCYLRYDCDNFILYIMVIAEPGYEILTSAEDNWVKVYTLGHSTQVDGNSASFAYIYNNNDIAIGWEASFEITESNYPDFEFHAEIVGASEGRTSSTNDIPVNLSCGALPVELTSFTVNLINNAAHLTWETVTEVNNYGFEIERSSNDFTWDKVGFVQGHGNSNSPKYYSFFDGGIAESGNYSFRLKQIDIDGSYEYSDVVNINLSAPRDFKLEDNFPNPFNPSTKISFSIPEDGFVTLRIYDVLGNEIERLENDYKSAGRYSYLFDASKYTSGIYFYTVRTSKYVETKKMLLMK